MGHGVGPSWARSMGQAWRGGAGGPCDQCRASCLACMPLPYAAYIPCPSACLPCTPHLLVQGWAPAPALALAPAPVLAPAPAPAPAPALALARPGERPAHETQGHRSLGMDRMTAPQPRPGGAAAIERAAPRPSLAIVQPDPSPPHEGTMYHHAHGCHVDSSPQVSFVSQAPPSTAS